MSYILPTIRRVAVIGAGPGGLVAAKQLKEEGVFDKISVFDRNDQIGGTWIYSPEQNANPPIPSIDATQVDPPISGSTSSNSNNNDIPPFNRLRSAIYNGLRTNLPTSVMCYRDFDFASDVPFFPSHSHVLDYLRQFAGAFDLEPMIRLGTKVVKAEYSNGANKEWTLTLQTQDQGYYKETYDAIVVANGHYSIPYIPAFDGIEALQDNGVEWIHSREYRVPSVYKDQAVLVIGSGSSGLDIVREVSKVAKKVYHCVRTDNNQSRQAHALDADNVERVGLVNRILGNGQFECGGDDGSGDNDVPSTTALVDVNSVIFATGYLYSFPFFPFEQDNLIVDGQSVLDLHEYLFYIKNPTLAFIGLPIRIVPLPLSQSQATVIARCWNPHKSDVSLPSQAWMEATYDKNRQLQLEKGKSAHQSFVLNVETEFAYVDRLSAWSEGYREDSATQSQLDAWRNTSTDPLTCALTEKWKQERIDALLLRKEYLGY